MLSLAVELGEVLTSSALERGVDGKQDPYSCFCISTAIASKVLAGCSESGSLFIREGVESQGTGSLEQGS